MSASDIILGSEPAVIVSAAPELCAVTRHRLSVVTCLVAIAAFDLMLPELGLSQSVTSTPQRTSESRPPSQSSGRSKDLPSQRGLAEELKAFLAAPPPLEMLAEVRESSSLTNHYYVLLRYQTNAFFYREAPTLAELSSPNLTPGFRAAGHYGEDYWSFSSDGRTLESAPQGDESMRQTLKHVIYRASKVFNLGVFDSLPQDIRWDGNSIRPFTNRYGVSREGELITSPNGQPEALDLLARFETNAIPWQVDYEFYPSATLPAYLPSKLTGQSLRNGVRQISFEVRFLQVQLSETPLSKDRFLPGTMAFGPNHQILHTPNGFLVGKSGRATAWHRVYTGPQWLLQVTRKIGLRGDAAALCWASLPWCAGGSALLLLTLYGWLWLFGRDRPSHREAGDETLRS